MSPHVHSTGHAGHAHGAHAVGVPNRKFAAGVALNLLFVVVQVVAGLMAHSLALVADAGHNLSDGLGLLLAWYATWLADLHPTPERTYGYRRATILAALANAMLLLAAVGALSWEAWRRLFAPAPVNGPVVIWVALLGVVINAGTAALFARGQKKDLNVRGAFLHMLSDAAVSSGVMLAGGLILLTGWNWLDPVVSLVINLIIVWGTWGLLRESLDLALDAVPSGIDPVQVRQHLEALPGVQSLHDLHIWPLSTTETALTVHLVQVNEAQDEIRPRMLATQLKERFGISHCTVQLETADGACQGACDDRIDAAGKTGEVAGDLARTASTEGHPHP